VQCKLGSNSAEVGAEPNVQGARGGEQGGGRDNRGFQRSFHSGPVGQGLIRGRGRSSEQRGLKVEEDRDMVRAGGGERVRPF